MLKREHSILNIQQQSNAKIF